MSDEESKIIIDEGWKSQVQRERDEAVAEPPVEDEAQAQAQADETEGLDYEPGFESLVASLATQTMLALGVIAPEGVEEVPINLDQAKFTIDILVMLREKTAGNLTEEESAHLDEALGELQQVFALRLQQYQEQAMQNAGVDPNQIIGQ